MFRMLPWHSMDLSCFNDKQIQDNQAQEVDEDIEVDSQETFTMFPIIE